MTSRAKWLLLIFLWLLLATLDLFGSTYYVATDGSDGAAGTIGAPFLTLEKARNTAVNGDTVFVRGGTYYRTNTFVLVATNSGVTYRGYTNEIARLVGGLAITNWGTLSNSIRQTSVNTQGFTGIVPRQLFFNGERQIMARFPNYKTNDPYGITNFSRVAGTGSASTFTYTVGDVHTWANPTNAFVFVYPQHNWWNNILGISSIDTGTHVISLSGSASYTISQGDRYFVQNLFEELDAVNEWYLNTNGMLYFWSPSDITAGEVVMPVIRTLVSITSATNITFRNFTLNACEGSAITLTTSTNCFIAANVIHDLGDYNGIGVDVSAGFTNGVEGNHIYNVGRHGVQITGGTATTLTPANNYADNNYIHNFGQLYKEGSAVNVTGVGHRVSYNKMISGPRFATYFRGQNIHIEYNEMGDVMQETDDGGIIYSENTDWLEDRGCVLRYNYLHDAPGWGFDGANTRLAYPEFSFGIYLDALTCGVDIFANVVTRSSAAGIMLNGGVENRVTNNIIYECNHGGTHAGNDQIHFVGFPTNLPDWYNRIDDFTAGWQSTTNQSAWNGVRGMNYTPASITYTASGYTWASNAFVRNIICYTNLNYSDLGYYALRVEFDRNKSDYNTIWEYGDQVYITQVPDYDLTWAQWQARGQDTHSTNLNPQITSPSTGDFTVSNSSPALALGFIQIPMSSIGRYASSDAYDWTYTNTPSPAAPRIAIVGSTIAGNVNSLR